MSNDDSAVALPASLQLAWGLRDAGRRGPKRGLNLDAIVTAGIRVASTEGLAALSMARVARELGAATMSLYRYVAAKDELLTLMVDVGLGAPPPSVHTDWRAGLSEWATGVLAAYRRHPWSLRVPISAPPLGPNNVAWLESALQSLAETPLTEREKVSIVLLLSGFVRNEATLTADVAAAQSTSGAQPTRTGYATMLTQLTTAADFPALHRAIDSGALDDDDDLDLEFNFGLNRLLDGVAVLIDRRSER